MMGILTKTYQVRPNSVGLLYRNNVLEKELPPGRYEVLDLRGRTQLLALPTTPRQLLITNQEVLTRDSIALRFSCVVLYRVAEAPRFAASFDIGRGAVPALAEAEQRLAVAVQLAARTQIGALSSEDLSERRAELTDLGSEALAAQAAALGLVLEQVQLRDLTFPKNIQDLFARHLEAKIRAKADLENARTAVATARALKNASELMKGDENMRFFQFMETITKIAEKGKHTFLVGEFPQLPK
jgi:regulator of protease activity HflC (stomatin/prohibitin superfamily)